MDTKTLDDMRAVAAAAAARRWHRIKKWRRDYRSHFRFTSRCEVCGAWIEITNRIHTPEEARRALQAGTLIVQDARRLSTDHDYIIGIGEALTMDCRG